MLYSCISQTCSIQYNKISLTYACNSAAKRFKYDGFISVVYFACMTKNLNIGIRKTCKRFQKKHNSHGNQ